MPFASHVTKRGRIFQYVRRVPEDIADAFPYARVQRSLKTADKAIAYAAAASIHAEVESQFVLARRRKGTTLNVIPTGDWEWPDWQKLADWFKAVLVEEDWRARLRSIPGAAFDDGVDRQQFWRDEQVVQAHIDLRARLRAMPASTYAEERFGFVQGLIRRLGVPLSKTAPYFERFMTSCLKAEMEYLAIFSDREGGKIEEAPHPDTINGRWRAAAERIAEQQAASILGIKVAKSTKVNRTLAECLDQWKGDRKRANKIATPHGIGEKEAAIAEFEEHASVFDVGEITREKIIAFRDYLFDKELKTPTVNKKVGQITTLLATAQKAGWIETAISGGIYIDVPAGTNEREPFDKNELARFSLSLHSCSISGPKT